MAAPSAGIAALLGPQATPSADTASTTKTETPAAPTPTSTVKSVEQLLKEIEQVKTDVEAATKTLEKIDTGKKKAAENRDRSIEGRTQVKSLNERVNNLQNELEAMTKDTDPNWPSKKFDKAKKTALKTLASLSKDLTQVDKHLERATGAAPAAAATTTTPASTEPAAAPPASPDKDNKKGVGSLIRKLPFAGKKKSSSKKSPDPTTPKPADGTVGAAPTVASDQEEGEDEEEEEEEEEDEEGEEESEDDGVVTDRKRGSPRPPIIMKTPEPIVQARKKKEVSVAESDESEYSEDEEDDADDDRQLLNELQSKALPDENSLERRPRTPPKAVDSRKAPAVKTNVVPSPSPRAKKSTRTTPSPSPPRKKHVSPRGRAAIPAGKGKDAVSDEDSYFEEEQDEQEEEELRRLRETDDREEAASEHDYGEPEEEEPALANTNVQELRTHNYTPGTQFLVTHDFTGTQTGDLTVRKGDQLTLIEQRSDDWWLFKNVQNEQGVVPINHIQLLSRQQQQRRRVKPSTSATTLADAFKANHNMPDGYIASDLAPLAQLEDYQLWRTLVPTMTESNLSFVDLHWRADTDKLHVQDVTHQKILTLKECVKIPRIKGEQVRVLDRCVRVCLYDGFEIISNIYTIRARVPSKIDARETTEDWHFASNDTNTLVDEQPQLLVRSNRFIPGQNLKLLIELSQYCQSAVTQEKCEVGCGWCMVSLDDDKPPFITDTKSYNELLNGGHTNETKVLLDPQYKVLHSNGLSGMIDRFKRARIKFSLESREHDVDVLYDNLPTQSLVVPMNLIKSLVFFRNELAYQFHKRHHPIGLSTTPIDSVFLSTFFQALSQLDLMDLLNRLYRSRKNRFLSSSASLQQQRELFIKTYELFIYPLLQNRQLPPYDFHDVAALNERRNLINDMMRRLSGTRKRPAEDILSILLDPNLTDKWTPFTTNEICFTLQKYIQEPTSDIVA